MPKVGPEYLNSTAKRSFDVVGSMAVGLALLPAEAIAYTAAAIDSRSLKPFFEHERIGIGGTRFRLSKLRTLRPELVRAGALAQGTYDKRASGIGLFLRRYGLDETPQLASVLEGDMSLVGVRAASDQSLDFLRDLAPNDVFEEWLDAYSGGRPGLIGPGQIFRHRFMSPGEEEYLASMRMDINYAKKASLLKDLLILGSAPLKLLEVNLRPVQAPGEQELPPAVSAPAI